RGSCRSPPRGASHPDSAAALSHLFSEQRYLCDRTDFEATETKLLELVRAGQFVTPFSFIAANTPPEEQLICARTWAAASLSSAAASSLRFSRYAPARAHPDWLFVLRLP